MVEHWSPKPVIKVRFLAPPQTRQSPGNSLHPLSMNSNYKAEFNARENLIESLIKDGYLRSPEIIEAFKNIDRADFILDEHKEEAYINAPLSIGFGQTISQPLVVAFMMELLEPKPEEKILDVGCGSGWTSAILSYIALKGLNLESSEKISPKIIAIERISELKEMAEKNIKKYNFIEKGIVKVILGDGAKGYSKESPFDKIIAGAAAREEIPDTWKKQLKIGGRIVSPVDQSIVVIDKTGEGEYIKKEYFGFSFVPLIEGS